MQLLMVLLITCEYMVITLGCEYIQGEYSQVVDIPIDVLIMTTYPTSRNMYYLLLLCVRMGLLSTT